MITWLDLVLPPINLWNVPGGAIFKKDTEMYYKELETDAKAKAAHDKNMKENAAARRTKNAKNKQRQG